LSQTNPDQQVNRRYMNLTCCNFDGVCIWGYRCCIWINSY